MQKPQSQQTRILLSLAKSAEPDLRILDNKVQSEAARIISSLVRLPADGGNCLASGVMLALISYARCRGCGDESCWNCFATPPLAQYCFTLSSHDHGLIASQQRGSNTAAHAALRMFHKRASIQIESYA
jgi:hypothetical protein